MDMHDPDHPGELLQGWIDDLNMSVTAFAEHIGISRPMLSRGMHWRTFERLKAEHDALVGESLAGMAKRFGLLDRFMD